MVKLYLHIGLPKTGTTTIQNWLVEHATGLAQAGIYTLPESALAHRLAVEGIKDPKRLSLADIKPIMNRDLDEAKTALRTAVEDRTTGRIILSSEYFSDVAPDEAKRMFSDMGLDDITAILVLRRQDRLFESAYNQSVKELGWTEPLLTPHYNPNYDWYRLVSSWADVFGNDGVIVRSYDEIVASGERLIPAVLKNIDTTIDAFATEHGNDRTAANPSLPAGLIEFRRLANIAAVSEPLGLLDLARERGLGGPRFRLDPLVARAWLDIYRDSNRRVAREFLDRDEMFDEHDLDKNSIGAGADFTNKLPVEILAQLLALFMEDEVRIRATTADLLKKHTAATDRARQGVASQEDLREVRQLAERLGEQIEELRMSAARNTDDLRVVENQLRDVASGMGTKGFLASPRESVTNLWKHLVSAFRRS